ncbi:MTAP family purine nucleoside phosphorylase [Candidatus Kuenenbacteria bacterium]|nr:MTAP family purine nucleoside phosphorylase [Candidatus Kuenenbacteria bacterium]
MSDKIAKLGVFGGTALFDLPFPVIDELWIITPFGVPSDVIKVLELPDGTHVYLMNRHGPGHVFSPSKLNYRANVYAMKKADVTHLLSLSACGSLSENMHPSKTLFVPAQLFDWTKGIRKHTFFEGDNDAVAHISFGDPICLDLAREVHTICKKIVELSPEWFQLFSETLTGSTVVIEGPRFSSHVESVFFKNVMGADAIAMTPMPEAALAREAGLCYAVLHFPADFDSWRKATKGVNADEVKAGLEPYKPIPATIIPILAEAIQTGRCNCVNSLEGFAIHSNIEVVPPGKMKKYRLLLK